jgi:hypothetical protein
MPAPKRRVNLTSPPLSADCTDTTTGTTFTTHFTNNPFSIEAYLPATAMTCPQPGVFAPKGLLPSASNLPGGCTKDIVHRFYQEQYQLNNGGQNRYVTGSDAVGLAMGYYDTTALPIYAYLHSPSHPHYAIADDFFQSAFGGSFLNHQWLVAAASPVWAGAPETQHAIIDEEQLRSPYADHARGFDALHGCPAKSGWRLRRQHHPAPPADVIQPVAARSRHHDR